MVQRYGSLDAVIGIGLCVLVVGIVALMMVMKKPNEYYANTSPSTDTRSLPGFRDYQVMSQLPWDNPIVGPGEMNFDMQQITNKDFPRHRWLIDVPISRPPDEVSLYQTGMFVDPSIMNISTGKF